MASEIKTKKTKKSVAAFIASVKNPKRKRDAKVVLALMKKVTGMKPEMWGPSIIGFGNYHYKYASGREGDIGIAGFSPRVQSLTIYNMPGYSGPKYQALLKKLGPHTRSKVCLYIKNLEQVDISVLEKIIALGVADMQKRSRTQQS